MLNKHCENYTGVLESCVHKGDCSLRALWQTLEQWMRGTLDQISLADLLQNEGRIVDLLRSRLAITVFEDVPTLVPLTMMTPNS